MQRLNSDKIASFESKVDVLSNEQVSALDINTLTAVCSSILIDAANEAGFIKESKRRPFKRNINLNTKPVKCPWFNNECENLRRLCKKAKT